MTAASPPPVRVPAGHRTLKVVLMAAGIAAAVLAGRTAGAARALTAAHAFLEFFAGVFTLVGLTGAVVFGLLAAARFTPIRLRILAQSGHRAAATLSLAFLAVHIVLKVLEKHATALDAVLPAAGVRGHGLMVSLGPVAGDLMVLAVLTGVARGRFIGAGRAWTWRLLHLAVYACWPVALVHGLQAGRAARSWVVYSYLLCAAALVLLVLVRLAIASRHRRTTGPRPVRPAAAARPQARRPAPAAEARVPDEQFWADLKDEARRWSRSRP
ncbi:hypothetical protein [Actinomadura verrucosospora]|uniref:Ferric reductase n=1 Tax=Actinomadura verrucosospora TaxID=46165 RepID=A0A7D3W151_ACTVE|nr:hypothetical protein [Actinomadura verrucosospora]QKG23856.1 ferric reductase [Actinomadura verrucosospora]